MPSVKLFNMNAEEVGSLKLNDDIFGVEYNEPVIHEVIVAMQANERQGTKSALTRSEVRGHAKKPYKQKHTGNARQGSTKGPHQIGGGVAFAPKPRDFSKKVNKQVKRLALVSALSEKLRQKEITFLDEFKLQEAKTKEVEKFLNAFKFDRTVLVVLPEKSEEVLRASRNIKNVTVATADNVNVYEIVTNARVVMPKATVKAIEEARI
ncbi:MAG TPA: 50S ribosomal protein L4 [Candidatus Caccopulliclostridium gallistercoris]|uniref:Large ribosomal subunit protein uL4 n=1 Tax=Candidatus Caccopulliclostridium gallistercoris TaxID=2840719 RepID=A0A9D1SYR5_9FIRM|nr:50S ribosomal protein L4 [Candidatus Caccopulliclostridium gallistercoris]